MGPLVVEIQTEWSLWQVDYSTGFQDNQNIVLLRLEFFTAQVLEDTSLKDKEKTFLIDIQQWNRLGKQEKPMAQATYEHHNLAVKSFQFL